MLERQKGGEEEQGAGGDTVSMHSGERPRMMRQKIAAGAFREQDQKVLG